MLARLCFAGPLALSLLAASATAAQAQGAPPPPPPLPTGGADPVAPGGYPLALTERPLLLPTGMLEASGQFWIPTYEGVDLFDVVSTTLAARYSTGTIEPFAGLELLLTQPSDAMGNTQADSLRALFAGLRAAVGPGVARATFSKFGFISDASWIQLDGRFEYKQKVGPKLAVVAEAGIFLNLLSADPDFSANAFYLMGRGVGQAQVAPAVALQGGLQLSVPVASGDNQDPDVLEWSNVTVLFGEGLYAMPKFDVFARLEITLSGDFDQTAFIVGVLARPM